MHESEVPDLGEQRALRALRRWLEEDEEGRAVLEELVRDRPRGQRTLRDRLERDAPPEVATHLSGRSNVGKLVNVAAEAASLHIHQGESSQLSPVRLALKPLSSRISIGDSEPCRVRVRIENDDARPHEVELKVTGWFSDLSQIEGEQRIIVRSGGYADTQIDVAIAPTRAAKLPAAVHQLEAQVVSCQDATILARATVPLEVLPFHWIDAAVEPPEIRCKQWRRAWLDYELFLTNRGNQDAEVTIGRVAGQSAIEINLQEDKVGLSPDMAKRIPVRVRPLRHAYLGERTYSFRLAANLRPQDHNEVTGALHHAPLVSKKKLAWIVAALCFMAFSLFVGPRLSTPSPAPGPTGQQAVSSTAADVGAPPATTPAVTQNPVAVVQAFYNAVNARDYPRAWELGGKNLGRSYRRFAEGFSQTDHVTVVVHGVRGATLEVDLIADEYHGRQHSIYKATYTVRNGEIVAGKMQPRP